MLELLYYQEKGARSDERSIRLNKQYRLTLQVMKDQQGNWLLILDIEDYH
jgi:proteic killer suppression protein